MAQETVIIIRPSFKRFCGQDTCRAALFNQFLFWIAWKAKDQPVAKVKSGEISWYGSGEEICADLDDSWSVNKVRKEIKELIEAGLIGQRHNPANGWDQTRHYFFGVEQSKVLREMCEKLDICLLHLGLPPNILHLLNLVDAINKNGKCNCQISEMDLPNMADPFTKSGNAIPKVTTEDTSKDTNKERENTPTRASQFSSEQNRIDELFFQCTRKRPTITDDLKGYWDTLAPDIKTLEDMRNLYAITEKECAGKTNPRVYPGNLADCLKLWRQQYGSLPWAPPDSSQPEPDKEPKTDVPMYADRPLFYWTEETMEVANLPKLRRQVIREKQMEWKQGQSVIAS